MKNEGVRIGRFEMNADTAILRMMMEEVKPGHILTYDEMSDAIGGDIRKMRHRMYSAMNILRREKGYLFDCVTNVGIKRMNDSDIARGSMNNVEAVKHVLKRQGKRLECIGDYDALTPEEKVMVDVARSNITFLSHVVTNETQKKISSRVENSMKAVPVGYYKGLI